MGRGKDAFREQEIEELREMGRVVREDKDRRK